MNVEVAAAASPEPVARVYLRAAFTGNCKLTAELTLPHTWNWCDDPKLLDYRSARSPYHVPASNAGRNEECVDFEMYTRQLGRHHADRLAAVEPVPRENPRRLALVRPRPGVASPEARAARTMITVR